MNTPSHVVLNLFVLGGKRKHRDTLAIVLGALLPDLPMLLFYFWVKLVQRLPERQIWETEYFRPHWQTFIDVFNAFPLMALGALMAALARSRIWLLFFASMALHAALDFPVHVDDGHAHFWPFTSWKFSSPVSYWDPNHHGAVVALIEATMVVGLGSWMALRRYKTRFGRWSLGTLVVLYIVGIGYVFAA